jgi:signal transduction histidine kinase
MRRSIRWQLPLSYAAIALLATVALGVVLLLTLRGYYGQLERAYLEGNALAFSYTLAPLLADDLPAESLQAQVISLSFLSQVRVRLLDRDGSPVADSSAPGRFAVSLAAIPERDVLLPAGEIEANSRTRAFIIINPNLPEPTVLSSTEILPSRLMFEPYQPGDPYGPLMIRSLSLVGGKFPLDLGSDADLAGPRSNQVVRQPVYNDTSSLLGYVELSEGPAYGQEIVTSVARGWVLSGVVAMALAAAVGWLVSRRISAPLLALAGVTASMAAGDLSARADVRRRDEFGTLACSFNTMADRLEDTVVTLRRFVSDAAHELNTPLATLRANLEMMRHDSAPEDSAPEDGAPEDGVPEDGAPEDGVPEDGVAEESLPGQNERLARAQAQVERLEVLARGMLDLSRIEAGMNQEAVGPVSLTALAQDMGELYASCAEQVGLAFELSLPEAPIIIRGDETQLRQALANLLDNAIKFTPEGGRVELGLGQAEGMANLWVEDTGIGIPAEDVPHLFQRFHRGRNTAGYPGSGLGLAIVKAIADRHGGYVTADSNSHSTRFSLQLPCPISACLDTISPLQ